MVYAYTNTEQFEKALELSDRMIDLFPISYTGYYLRAQCLQHLNKPKDSIASYDEALKHATELKSVSFLLTGRSNSHLMVGNWKEALSDAERSLEINPKGTPSFVNKCNALKRMGKEEKAVELLKNVLPEIKEKYLRACIFAVLDEKAMMLKELEAAIKEDIAYRVSAKFDPEFAEYRDDLDFKKLVFEERMAKKAKKGIRSRGREKSV